MASELKTSQPKSSSEPAAPSPDAAAVKSPGGERRRGVSTKQRSHYALNWSLLIKTAVALALLGPATYFWHDYQVGRNAAALLSRATTHEKNEKWAEAAGLLHLYLRMRPYDVEARVRVAQDFDKSARGYRDKMRAVMLYGAAIAQAPDRDDLLRRQMELNLEVENYRTALEQANKMLKRLPDDPVALRVKALGLRMRLRLKSDIAVGEVIEAFEAAIPKNRDDATLASELAHLYRTELTAAGVDRDNNWKKADGVMDQLVEASSKPPQALLARYLYRKEFHLFEPDADLARALAADPRGRDFSVHWQAGQRELEKKDFNAAAKYFQQAINADSRDRRGYLGLGHAYSGNGQERKAIRAWQDGLTKSDPYDLDLQVQIAAAQVRLREWEPAEKSLRTLEKQLAQIYGPQHAELMANISLLRAETQLGQERPVDAVPLFKQALKLQQAGADSQQKIRFRVQILSRLGQCYLADRQWDQAAAAFQKAGQLQPADATLRLAAARAWELADRFDDAARTFEDALSSPDVPREVWADLVRVEFRRQQALPPSQRNWQDVARTLAKARQELPDSVALRLSSAELAVEQGQLDSAIEQLKSIEETALADRALATRLIFAYERAGRAEQADRLAAELAKREGDNAVDAALASSELYLRRGRQADAVDLLGKSLTELKGEAQQHVRYRLALSYLIAGDMEHGREQLRQLVEQDVRDVRPMQLLAEFALQAGEYDEVERLEQQLLKREGPEGTSWRFYRAQRLVLAAIANEKISAAEKKKTFDAAEELQQEIERLRPTWAPGYTLKAMLAERDTPPQDDDAIQAYVQAIKLGENGIAVYESLIFLLYRQNRIAEADVYLSRLRETVNLPTELAPVAMAIDVKQGNLPRAIETVQQELGLDPNNPLSHLRLGYLLSLQPPAQGEARTRQLVEAEKELKRARELAPDDVRTWSALLTFYNNTDQQDSARAMLDELKQSPVLSKSDLPFFLAQSYTILKDLEQAKGYYQEAIAAAPDRADVQLQAAGFFFSTDPPLAEKCLRRVLEIDPNQRAASRLLATLLASRGGSETELEQVWDLLDPTSVAGSNDVTDRRLKAILWLRRGGSQYRHRAQELLESLAADPQNATPIDRLLLARLYEAQGQSVAAREQLQALVNSKQATPDHLAAYVDNLLRAGQARQASDTLDELAKAEPEKTSFRTLGLRTRWLQAVGREASVPVFIGAFVDNELPKQSGKPAQARLLVNVANLYASLDLPVEAEDQFRRAIELDVSARPTFAMWLAKCERGAEAVKLCLEVADQDESPLTAMTLYTVLALTPASDEDRQAAQPVLDRARQKFADHPGLLFSAASMCLMQGDDDQAIELLRRLLKKQPNHRPALNNLAMLLANKPSARQEAIDCIDRAIALAGMAPELIDSKGWIVLQQGKPEEAESLFKEAISLPPGDPRHYFHLALACQLQGKIDEARQAWQKAQERNLNQAALSPSESAESQHLSELLH